MGIRLNSDIFKDSIDRRLSAVQMDQQLRSRILDSCRPVAVSSPPAGRRRWGLVRRGVAVAAACAVIFSTSLVCIAANRPLRDSLSRLGDDVLLMLQPINTVSESSGIRMEVLAAMNDDDIAVIYLTLQDTEKLGRLDDSIELQSFTVQVQNGAGEETLFSNTDVLWYDEETQTATLQLTSQAVEVIAGHKLSLNVRSLLSGRSDYTNVETGYTLADIARANPMPALLYPQALTSYSTWGPLSEQFSQRLDRNEVPVLSPLADPVQLEELPWLTINNAAIVDNLFHIQLAYDDDMGRFNRVNAMLTDPQGNAYDVSGMQLTLQSTRPDPFHEYISREEQILVIPGEALYDQVQVRANVVTYEHYLEGRWDATFCLQDADDSLRRFTCDLDMNPWRVNEITLSPIGVTVYGEGEMYAYSDSPEVEVYLKDGSLAETSGGFSSSSMSEGKETHLSKVLFSSPIAMEDVARLVVNGEEFSLEE